MLEICFYKVLFSHFIVDKTYNITISTISVLYVSHGFSGHVSFQEVKDRGCWQKVAADVQKESTYSARKIT